MARDSRADGRDVFQCVMAPDDASRLSFRFPQCASLRSGLNTRSTWRFRARMTPMRKSQPGSAGYSWSAVERTADGKLGLKKYAVGLEIPCPGSANYWAPETPSAKSKAGATPNKCEPVHNRRLVRTQVRAPSSGCSTGSSSDLRPYPVVWTALVGACNCACFSSLYSNAPNSATKQRPLPKTHIRKRESLPMGTSENHQSPQVD
jgi:hypothetical protein